MRRRFTVIFISFISIFLILGTTIAEAETIFNEDFETGSGGWEISNGVWEVGSPTVGPGGCFNGAQCAGTVLDGNYSAYDDSRLISPSISIPALNTGEELHLRFMQWFSYSSYDSGQVQIQVYDEDTGEWGAWENIGGSMANTSPWSLKDIDISAYAGLTVRIGFYHSADQPSSYYTNHSTGWYIDDIEVVAKAPEFDGSFESGWEDWGSSRGIWQIGTPTSGPGACYSGESCAGTVLDGNYKAKTDSRLVSVDSLTDGNAVTKRDALI